MLIGVISDTHDNLENVEKACGVFRSKNIALVLHAGDITTPYIVRALGEFRVIAVWGNCDVDRVPLAQAFSEIGGESKGDFGEIGAGGLSFALYHGVNQNFLAGLVQSGKYDFVITGHTHSAVIQRETHCILLNPGTAAGVRADRASIALINTASRYAEIVEL